MSKTIKLKDDTYKGLEGQLRPRETFDEAVSRLLEVSREVGELLNVLEGQIRYREGQLARLRETPQTD